MDEELIDSPVRMLTKKIIKYEKNSQNLMNDLSGPNGIIIFKSLPLNLKTVEASRIIVKYDYHAYSIIPKHCRTPSITQLAIQHNERYIRFAPEKSKTFETCKLISNKDFFSFIPRKYIESKFNINLGYCAVCLKNKIKLIMFPCNHGMCYDDFSSYIKSNNFLCHYCRREYNLSDIYIELINFGFFSSHLCSIYRTKYI